MPRMGESMTSRAVAPRLRAGLVDALDGEGAGAGVADDATLADVLTAGLELRA